MRTNTMLTKPIVLMLIQQVKASRAPTRSRIQNWLTTWTNDEIVAAYRAQNHIESAFRDMKNPHFLGWSPMFHWRDRKI